jgi:hypothetical protein
VIAIIANERTNSAVAQSLFSILGWSTVSIIAAKLLVFISFFYYLIKVEMA